MVEYILSSEIWVNRGVTKDILEKGLDASPTCHQAWEPPIYILCNDRLSGPKCDLIAKNVLVKGMIGKRAARTDHAKEPNA